MHLPSVLFLTAFAIFYCSPVSGEPNVRLPKVYDVSETQMTNGGCGRYWYQLEGSYMEALELVHAAQVAIDSLRGVPRPNPSNPHNVAAYNEWVRVAGVFYALFGYQIDPKTGLVVEDPDTANFSPGQKVCVNFQRMTAGNSVTNRDPPPPTKFFLRCNDDYFEWKNPKDPDPNDPDGTISERFVDGAYYAPFLPGPYNLFAWEDVKPKQKSPLCENTVFGAKNGKALAETEIESKLLTFCKNALLEKDWSVAAFKNMMKKPGGFIGDYDGLAMTWVHEWGHLILKFRDEQTVDKWGRPLVEKGHKVLAYGWLNTVRLAKNDAEKNERKALQTPESYALFTAAMYYSQWNWATGKAARI